jgi:hypothetical protein
MNPLDLLFGQIANSVRQHSSPDTPGPAYDANPILGALSNVFGQHAQQNGQQFGGYDPNAQYENRGPDLGGGLFGGGQQSQGGGYDNVQSSDADPYGDPGAQGSGYGNVQSSDADPYGDPGAR